MVKEGISMCEMPNNDAAPPKGAAVYELPGRIIDNCCSWCRADVSYLFEKIERGEIKPPKHCPSCGKAVRSDAITAMVWQCENCRTEIVNPGAEKFCPGCGYELMYPEEMAGQLDPSHI